MSIRAISIFFLIELAAFVAGGRLAAEPIERTHPPVFLDMPLALFLEKVGHEEERPEAGQFKEERRFHVGPSLFSPETREAICDFFKERLFRIELNYRAISKARAQEIGEGLTRQYGTPRRNTFPGTEIWFWDDGKTRVIFQKEGGEGNIDYSMTYLDVAMFHQASRERVKKETVSPPPSE